MKASVSSLTRVQQRRCTTVGGMRLDNGDYPQRVRVCAEFSDLSAIRARQQKGEPEGQLVDIGFAAFAVV